MLDIHTREFAGRSPPSFETLSFSELNSRPSMTAAFTFR